jgi:3-oxoacyl-[acyl-carrier protein] reductase
MSAPRPFEGKVAIVTGASRGIGRAVAERLAKGGAFVFVNFTSREAAAGEVLSAIRANGGDGELLRFDVSRSAEVAAGIDHALAQKGRLDILVNNAGISRDGLLVRAKDDDFDTTIAINLRGAFACARAVAKPMMKQRAGRIVNLTSVVGEAGNAGQSVYAASKAGIVGFTRALAQELASRGITVNAVSPGLIDTDMTAAIPAEARDAMLREIPAGRAGTAAEVAHAVAFLCEDQSAYITGQVLRINGGMYV